MRCTPISSPKKIVESTPSSSISNEKEKEHVIKNTSTQTLQRKNSISSLEDFALEKLDDMRQRATELKKEVERQSDNFVRNAKQIGKQMVDAEEKIVQVIFPKSHYIISLIYTYLLYN